MEENKNEMAEQEGEREFFTLTDEEGNEVEFELIDTADYQGVTYYAMIPADAEGESDDGFQEYVILKMEKDENGICWSRWRTTRSSRTWRTSLTIASPRKWTTTRPRKTEADRLPA